MKEYQKQARLQRDSITLEEEVPWWMKDDSNDKTVVSETESESSNLLTVPSEPRQKRSVSKTPEIATLDENRALKVGQKTNQLAGKTSVIKHCMAFYGNIASLQTSTYVFS